MVVVNPSVPLVACGMERFVVILLQNQEHHACTLCSHTNVEVPEEKDICQDRKRKWAWHVLFSWVESQNGLD